MKKRMNDARHLGVGNTHLGTFKVDRSGGVSAVLDRIRSTPVELFPHHYPPNQPHTAEHVWQSLDHSTACVPNVHMITGNRGLRGKKKEGIII